MSTFISYAREDSEFVLRLGTDLRAAGADIWVDQLDIPAGQPWDRAIQRALEACERVIVVLSPSAVESENVMDEVGFALNAKKRIVPILHEPCTVPYRLARLHYVDFTGNREAALTKLVSTLDADAGGRVDEPPPPPPPTGGERPNWVRTGLLGTTAVIVLALAAWGIAGFGGADIPLPPIDASGEVISPTSARITWRHAGTGETGFEIERSSPTESFTLVGTVAANVEAHEDTGLAAGQEYEYRVRALGPDGRSDYSNVARVILPVASSTPQPRLSAAAFRPSTVSAGDTSSLVVSLSGPAPAGGVELTITNASSAEARGPETLRVVEGATTGRATVRTSGGIAGQTTVRFRVSDGTESEVATLTVAPAGPRVVTTTMEPGTGFIFGSQRATRGTGVDRDIWWNRRELVPSDQMYSLGIVSDVRDIRQVATGELRSGAFEPRIGEGFALRIIAPNGGVSYAILRVTAVSDDITLEWLYPFTRQVTGN